MFGSVHLSVHHGIQGLWSLRFAPLQRHSAPEGAHYDVVSLAVQVLCVVVSNHAGVSLVQ